MCPVVISTQELFKLETQSQKDQLVQAKIFDKINSLSIANADFYPFDSHWIMDQKFCWEVNIQISVSRKFDQFAFINKPSDPNAQSFSTIYVHGPRYQHKQDLSKEEEVILEVPYYSKLPVDVNVRHSRNALIKDFITYEMVMKNGDIKIYYISPANDPKAAQPMNVMKVPMTVSGKPNFDIWVHLQKKGNKKGKEIF